jgi:hypothetical protein
LRANSGAIPARTASASSCRSIVALDASGAMTRSIGAEASTGDGAIVCEYTGRFDAARSRVALGARRTQRASERAAIIAMSIERTRIRNS